MMKQLLQAFLLFVLFLVAGHLPAQVVINEISAANVSTVTDDFSQYEDWIELYNPGAAAVDISNYFLSDNPANPTKWQIPAGTVLNAGAYRLFFCSGRDVNTGLALHTNFKLTQTTNEQVLFSDNGGALIDSYTLQPTLANHSRGRVSGNWKLFATPTPGTANTTTAYDGYAATPTMSVASGIYAGAQTVSLATTTAGASIRYTLDGSEPTAASPLYSAPLTISTPQVVRARAYPTGATLLPGFMESNSYLIGISHTVPVVSLISSDYNGLFNSGFGQITSGMEYFNASGTLQFETYGEVDPHGNDSWAYAQKGVDFVVRDQYGYDDQINYPVFPTKPRQKFQRLIFKAGASDNYPLGPAPGGTCHLRDAFVQSLAEKANLNVDLRSTDHCVVYINGQYWGVYEIREKVNDPDYTDYYWNQEEEDLDLLSFWGWLVIRYGSDVDWNDLYAYIMANDLSVPANYAAVDARLDVASVIDYIILNSWSVNSDWMNWNTMWWRGRGTPAVKWKYALWDMDNIFNLGQNYSGWPTTNFDADPCALDNNFTNAGPQEGHLDIFNRLMANPDFKQRYVNRYAELINTYLSCDYTLAHLDSIVNHISPEMPGQISRWGGSMTEWQSNLDYLRDQITGRCDYIENQGIVNCYNVNGPHELTFNVTPAGSGTIQFNQLQVPNYPWSGSYFGGIDGDLMATPSTPAYEFDYWEVFSSVLNSPNTDAANSFAITGPDSIVAHFRPIITHDITFLVEPPNSGTISINGVSPASYPHTQTWNETFPVSLLATPATNFEFVEYTNTSNTLSPDPLQPSVFFQVLSPDTIIAHFKPLQTWFLTVEVEPEGAGKVLLNGSWLQYYPQTLEFIPNTPITLGNYAFDEYLFEGWELKYHALQVDSALADNGFVIDTTDTLVAHFKLKEVIPQTMYVPTGFTPNGDGLNDAFQVYHTEVVTEGDIRVYNRWGEQVFVSSILDFKWDGTIDGHPLPNDVYYYVLNYYTKPGYAETIQGRINMSR